MSDDLSGLSSDYLRRSSDAIGSLDLHTLDSIAAALIEARRSGNTVYVAGNGGSASTASHIAVDFMKSSAVDHGVGLRTVALNDNVPSLTAIANDADYASVFSTQLEWHLKPGDMFLAISASGNSANILRAAEVAKSRGNTVVALTGFGGGRLAEFADMSLVVDSSEYGPVEDAHLVIGHLITSVLRSVV